jgi:putative nucleotidyltransferase with HDIG domain
MSLLERFRSSLTYPIAATLVLVTVVPVATVGLLLARYNRDKLTISEKQYLTRQAVSLASEVDLFFSMHTTQLESTVRALAAGNPLTTEASQSLVQELAGKDQSYALLWIANMQGQAAASQSGNLSDEAFQFLVRKLREVHDQVKGGEPVRELHVPLPGTGAMPGASNAIAAFGYPLRSRRGTIWGTLEGAVDLVTLYRRITDTTYASLIVSIVDEDGDVMLTSRRQLQGESLAASPLVEAFTQNPLRLTQTYIHPVRADWGEVLGSVAPVEGWGWGVVVERPTADAFATVRVMQRQTLSVTAVAAIIALGIGFSLSRRLIVPIQHLAGTSSAIADGDLAVRADVDRNDELAQLATNFNNMAGNIEALVRRLRQALRQNQELFIETIRTLAAAIDAKDPYTRGHSERVSTYAIAIARHFGMSQEEVFRIRVSAILHDVGKLGIRDGILNKPGGLTDEEFAIMRRHAEIGAQIMSPIRMLNDAIPGIRNHHESWDGKGYPDRLKGEEIPLVARIIGVADTFDAMTTTRPYQKAMTLEYVIEKMKSMSGSRFDPKIIEAFLKAVTAGDMTPASEKTKKIG